MKNNSKLCLLNHIFIVAFFEFPFLSFSIHFSWFTCVAVWPIVFKSGGLKLVLDRQFASSDINQVTGVCFSSVVTTTIDRLEVFTRIFINSSIKISSDSTSYESQHCKILFFNDDRKFFYWQIFFLLVSLRAFEGWSVEIFICLLESFLSTLGSIEICLKFNFRESHLPELSDCKISVLSP